MIGNVNVTGRSCTSSEPYARLSPYFLSSVCQMVCGQKSAITTPAVMAKSGPWRMPLNVSASQTNGISQVMRNSRRDFGNTPANSTT